jgi:hypothetical protein
MLVNVFILWEKYGGIFEKYGEIFKKSPVIPVIIIPSKVSHFKTKSSRVSE